MQDREFIFSGQRSGEKVLAVVKSHPIILFWPGVKSIFFILIGAGFLIFHPSGFPLFLIVVVALFVAFGIFSQAVYCYSQNVAILTDQRIINVSQQGFLKRAISEVDIKNIQDISSATNGFAKTIFKYGDLIIRSAGASQGTELVIKDIPSPYEIQKSIALVK